MAGKELEFQNRISRSEISREQWEVLYGEHMASPFTWREETFLMRIAMIPFGLLSGFMDSKEIRITELGEDGFRFRLAEEMPGTGSNFWSVLRYEKAGYRRSGDPRGLGWVQQRSNASRITSHLERETGKYSFTGNIPVRGNLKDYVQEVGRLAFESTTDISVWKPDGSYDGELAKSLIVSPRSRMMKNSVVWCLEEQKKRWIFQRKVKVFPEIHRIQMDTEVESTFLWDNVEFVLESNRNSPWLKNICASCCRPLLASTYWQKLNYLTHSYFVCWIHTGWFLLEISSCHNPFPTEEQPFSIMDKMYLEGLEIRPVLSYIREFKALSGWESSGKSG